MYVLRENQAIPIAVTLCVGCPCIQLHVQEHEHELLSMAWVREFPKIAHAKPFQTLEQFSAGARCSA